MGLELGEFMIRKSTILKSLTALVMSALSTTAVQAEVLVPIDQFLANTTRHYEANQYKTKENSFTTN